MTRDHPELLGLLARQAEVQTAADLDEALARLRSEPFDVVLSTAADLGPLGRQAPGAAREPLLEALGHGVCAVDRGGRMVWANPKLLSYPGNVVETIRWSCAELCRELAACRPAPRQAAVRRRGLSVGQYEFELTLSPACAADGSLERVVALVMDVTGTRWLQKRMGAIEAAGAELVRLDVQAAAELDASERLRLLEDKIVRYSHDLLHFDHFALMVLEPRTRRLEVLMSEGLPAEVEVLELYARPEGNGIAGYVAATGRSYLCHDVSHDPHYLPGLEGARSCLTVPLRLHDQIIGVLNAESDALGAFSADDLRVAEIFGHYVALALNMLRLLAAERHITAGQIAQDAASELAAPLNNILVQAQALLASHPADDGLRQRAQAMIASVARVRQALEAMSQQPAVAGLLPESAAKDPLLTGKRILVADDEEIIRETIADVLSRSGALAATARDGNEALDQLRAQRFDLVLSDIKMPQHSGYEVFAAARRANPDCMVILITGFGYDPNHAIVRASREGLAGVLFKPFKVQKLLEEVRRALGAPRG